MSKMSKMVLIISILIISLAHNCYGEEWKIYKSLFFNYIVKYPTDWQVKETRENGGMVFFVSPRENEKDFASNIGITVRNVTSIAIIQKLWLFLTEWDLKLEVKGYKLLEKSKTKIGNKDIMYWIGEDANGLKGKTYIFIHNSRAYIFTYLATAKDFSKYLEQADSMVKLFIVE